MREEASSLGPSVGLPESPRHSEPSSRAEPSQRQLSSARAGLGKRAQPGAHAAGQQATFDAGNRAADVATPNLADYQPVASGSTGTCGDRVASGASNELWAQIREEAVAAVERDRVMSEIIRDTVLIHENFGDALAHRLARKLGDYALSVETLESICCEALSADPAIEDAALADLNAVRDRDPACPDFLTPFLFFKGYHAIQAYRFGNWLWKRGRQHLANHIQSRVAEVFAVDIHPAARLGRGILLDHGTGVVVGETAVIEDEVSLLQSVTLGGTGKQCGQRHPTIRRGVLIGAGAKILGAITVGEGAKIGAGSIVLENVHPFTTVVGNPARAVGTRHTHMPALTMDQSLPALDYMI